MDELNRISDMKWSLIPAEQVIEWSNQANKDLSIYNEYTNPHFLEVTRDNALFLSTTKTFFLIFLPAMCLIYFLLNRVFHLLFHLRVSQYFRNYSLWLDLLVTLFVSNSSDLCFNSLQ